MIDARDALDEARAAAVLAGVRIDRVASPDELDVLRSTMESIWGPEIVPPRNLLRGLALGGACLMVAHHDDAPAGFALGWLGWEGGVHFHSHQVGVNGSLRGSGVGFALKLAQRAQCLEHGVAEMRWTFDPLLAANARFNLSRLGARPIAFLPHCYGDRRDAFNTGDVTDRIEVTWRLDAPVGAGDREPGPADEVIEVPRDFLALRAADPAAGAHHRARVGAALAHVFSTDRVVRGWSSSGYVIGDAP